MSPMHPRPRRGWASALGMVSAAALALTLAACGTDDEPELSPAEQRMLPTEEPEQGVLPSDTAPRDSREVEGEGYSFAVPADFQQRDETSSNGEPMTVLERPSSQPDLPVRVVVVRDAEPEQPALEQSYTLEVTKRNLGGEDIVRTQVDWPGAQSAYVTEWTEHQQTAQESVPVHFMQLMVQVDETLILNIVGSAPAGDFEGSGIDEMVSTFRPAGPLA